MFYHVVVKDLNNKGVICPNLSLEEVKTSFEIFVSRNQEMRLVVIKSTKPLSFKDQKKLFKKY